MCKQNQATTQPNPPEFDPQHFHNFGTWCASGFFLLPCKGALDLLRWVERMARARPPPPKKKEEINYYKMGDPDQLLFSWIYLSLVIPIYNLWFFIGFAQFLSVVPTSQVTNEGFFVSLGKIKITASIKHLQFVFFSRLILEFWMSRESSLGKKVVFFQLFSSAVVFG